MFHAGDLVEVRSREEIMAMMQPHGRLWKDRLPFMPEMLQYCGKQFRVANVAHKTCDTATLLMGRRMRDTVFLEDLRCDGSAHGGCQARCLLFWRTQWLKPVDESAGLKLPPARRVEGPTCTEESLGHATHSTLPTGQIRYSCQATEHWAASEPLKALAPWHFIADLRTGNATLSQVVKVVFLQLVYRARTLPRGWRFNLRLYAYLHRLIFRRPDPFRPGLIPEGERTPEERLNLQPGEMVEVKSHDEILTTITHDLRNRGMKYNSEMTPACGGKFRVAQRVDKIIEEKSGLMITMKNPCITLEGVYCQALYTYYSPLCSRRAPPYFREIWLKRASEGAPTPTEDATPSP
jgi:hypothetical protein